MAEEKTMRLSLVAKQINVGTSTILQFLSAKGHKVDNNPNAKLNFEQLTLLANEFGAKQLLETQEVVKPMEVVAEIPVPEPIIEKAPEPIVEEKKPDPVVEKAPEPEITVEAPKEEAPVQEVPKVEEKQIGLKVLGKIDLDKKGNPVAPKPAPKPVEPIKEPVIAVVEEPAKSIEKPEEVLPVSEVKVIEPIVEEPEVIDIQLIEARGETLRGLTVLGKIELPVENDRSGGGHKHKRKRIIKDEKKPVANEGGNRPAPAGGGNTQNKGKDFGKKPAVVAPGAKPLSKEELSDKDIQEQIKATMARLQGASAKQSFGAEKRKEKRKGRADAE
jgi:translation initiation factor IF-2